MPSSLFRRSKHVGTQLEQITAEYRRLALRHHPDKHADDAAADGTFRAIQEAYDCLRDPAQRKIYDAYLAAGVIVPFSIWKAKMVDHPVRRGDGSHGNWCSPGLINSCTALSASALVGGTLVQSARAHQPAGEPRTARIGGGRNQTDTGAGAGTTDRFAGPRCAVGGTPCFRRLVP